MEIDKTSIFLLSMLQTFRIILLNYKLHWKSILKFEIEFDFNNNIKLFFLVDYLNGKISV